MKKYFNIIVILFLAICCSSCLDANLEELDTYEGKEITGVVGVYHRYYDDSYIHNGSGEQAVKQANLSVADILIDKEAELVRSAYPYLETSRKAKQKKSAARHWL